MESEKAQPDVTAPAKTNDGALSRSLTTAWRRSYAGRLIVSDFLVIVVVMLIATAGWLWQDGSPLLRIGPHLALPSFFAALALVATWSALLAFFSTRDQRYLGAGPAEYRSVVNATAALFGIVLVAIFLFDLNVGKRALVSSFVIGLVALLLERWGWRQWLLAARKRGEMSIRILVAGSASSVAHLADELSRQPQYGYRVVGACIPERSNVTKLGRGSVPVLGTFDDIIGTMERYSIDTLAIASSDKLPPARVRELSWQLEPGSQHLVVAPSLTDVGGPRISMRPVSGLPLIHVETPKFDRGQQALKRTVDLLASAALILALSPVLAIVALAVKLGSPGPILFRQPRVGLNGELFTMLKFRSMKKDAEALLEQLTELDREEGNAVLFKMKDDPRVTRVGAFIRRFSLDELPQLLNVFKGEMSLVGPRPPLPAEVEQYEDHVHRRFLMKPGITGLWQVSGRSNLSWEDSVRLDLYYVENWSLTHDVVILWRTVKAVLQRDGAY
jgi:exopolysaccharide biosynthesis polyprenyl glycosylphosphotransferase